MRRHTFAASLIAVITCGMAATGQETTTPPALPAVVIPVSTDEAKVPAFRMTDVDALTPDDLSLGPLTNASQPTHYFTPELRSRDISGGPKAWSVSIVVGNVIPFGRSTIPLLIRGEPKRIIQIDKPGLIARAPIGQTFDVREGNPLQVVLENPTAFTYTNVKTRWRFEQSEVCFTVVDTPADGNKPQDAVKCDAPDTWTGFKVNKYTTVSLRVMPPAEWFVDQQTGFPRDAKRTGVLTLRFAGDPAADGTRPVYEQLLPLDVQFNPGDRSVFYNLVWVAAWLFGGAMLALVLRVAIPNYRRKEALKEQLAETEAATRDILFETSLQVLIKVERAGLDQLRRRSWILGPQFADIAQRTEQGLTALKRKIEFTRRLDTSRGRRLSLARQDVPPTRVLAIDRQLNAACEVLLREELTEPDWVFAQQRLEAADKLLVEPTQEEKEAFQAFLVQRWKSVSSFFTLQGRKLNVPGPLTPIKDAFPSEEALPLAGADGSEWVQQIGLARADLQLSALEILRDFLFLATSVPPSQLERFKGLLTTPSMTELTAARLLMREISENVSVAEIVGALQAGEADIKLTPESVRANEKVTMVVRFRNSKLDDAAARQAIRCEWIITPVSPPVPASKVEAIRDWIHRRRHDPPSAHNAYGWEISHCFPETVEHWHVAARFHVAGSVVCQTSQPGMELHLEESINLIEHTQDWGNRVERIFPEAIQLGAALLVPLATLAVTQSGEGTTGRWWELIGVGFGSEMIRSILTGKPDQTP